ncbi:UNVERIFIED_CONTAM: hypothetical protein H355_016389, partial [Colinus virginianus]
MAADKAWTCAICCCVRQDMAHVVPCNHAFCLGCILRWAAMKDSCPMCRTAMDTIRVSVRGDEHVECVVSPPAVPVPTLFGPSGTAASAPPPAPASPEAMPAEPERAGGLLPGDWAALFRVSQGILAPVLPWLQQELCRNQELRWWEINWAKSVILAFLCQVGPDRNLLAQCVQRTQCPISAPLIDALVANIESWCGPEARRLLGLQEHNNAQEQEVGPQEPSAAQEQMQRQRQRQRQEEEEEEEVEEPGPAATGPS